MKRKQDFVYTSFGTVRIGTSPTKLENSIIIVEISERAKVGAERLPGPIESCCMPL
jgi:hypothetical protein